MNINDLLNSQFDLMGNPEEMLRQFSQLKTRMDANINQALLQIDSLEDGKVKEFLKNSVSLAKKGELNVEQFSKDAEKIIKNAS